MSRRQSQTGRVCIPWDVDVCRKRKNITRTMRVFASFFWLSVMVARHSTVRSNKIDEGQQHLRRPIVPPNSDAEQLRQLQKQKTKNLLKKREKHGGDVGDVGGGTGKSSSSVSGSSSSSSSLSSSSSGAAKKDSGGTVKTRFLFPRLYILGTQKGGSSSLYELMLAHPLFCGGDHKEPMFFKVRCRPRFRPGRVRVPSALPHLNPHPSTHPQVLSLPLPPPAPGP